MHNEGVYNLRSLSYINRVMKSRSTRWMRHVTLIGKVRNADSDKGRCDGGADKRHQRDDECIQTVVGYSEVKRLLKKYNSCTHT